MRILSRERLAKRFSRRAWQDYYASSSSANANTTTPETHFGARGRACARTHVRTDARSAREGELNKNVCGGFACVRACARALAALAFFQKRVHMRAPVC